MKIYYTIAIFLLLSFSAKAQKILYKLNGVTLTYQAEFVNTLNCGGRSINQYKIIVSIENNSGKSINSGSGLVDHTIYRNRNNVDPCEHPFPSSAPIQARSNWPNSSTDTYSYYLFVPANARVPDPTWQYDGFTFSN